MTIKPPDDSYIIDVSPLLAVPPISKLRSVFTLFNSATVFLSAIDIELGYGNGKSGGAAVQFNYSEDELRSSSEVAKEKSLSRLEDLGGVRGIAQLLKADEENGISDDSGEISLRQAVFGVNTYVKPPAKGLFHFVYEAFLDINIIILLVCASLSVGFGISLDGSDRVEQGQWLFFTVLFAVILSAGTRFVQFEEPSRITDNIQVDAQRSGQRQRISILDVVVGDIVFLKIGDQIPADGLFSGGQALRVDESSMTGENELVEIDDRRHPFLLSGTKVVDGYGHMLVTAVGRNTAWEEMMSTRNHDNNDRTLSEARLGTLTSSIKKIGSRVAVLVLIVSLVRYDKKDYNGSKTKFDNMNAVVDIVADAFTLALLVATPEDLPLHLAVTYAYSTMKRMMVNQAMVRKLSACETMGTATTICTDKTGMLTLNQMKVAKFWLGKEEIGDGLASTIGTVVVQLLHQGVALNTTASFYRPTAVSEPQLTGSPTEKAILSWAMSEMELDIEEVKHNYSILRFEAFSSEKKRSGLLIRKNDEMTIHVHWKGAAEMILGMCSHYYEGNGKVVDMNQQEKWEFENIIRGMAANGLRCIAFAHGHLKEELKYNEEGKLSESSLKEDGLILLGIVGIKDPCRPGVREAVKSCQAAGVHIKMITGDNVFTARAIAIECGILEPDLESNDGTIVEGIAFREYTEEERQEKVDIIRVMARSSPRDKLSMVQCLKQKGHVVAVTGDGTNDAPALKEADIGLSMGIQGTEVAKESSDIIILDDNFASIVALVQRGRCVYNNIQKFIQFQLTVTVVALVINFIAVVSGGEAPLTVMQLFWVNLIMDTLAALALATERPTHELMKTAPVRRTAPLITNVMWRNLITQSIFQIVALLTLQFKGKAIFSVNDKAKDTIIFNTYVLCQVFNELNARSMEKKNVFKGIHKNKLFLGIIGFTIVLQGIMVELLKNIADTARLNWGQWGACIGIAAISWLLGCVAKCFPVPETPIPDLFRQLWQTVAESLLC